MIQAGQQEIASLESQMGKLSSAKEETEAELATVHQQLDAKQEILDTFGDVIFLASFSHL